MTSNDIWVFIERDGDEIEEVSLEILGKASEITKAFGYSLTGVLLGTPSEEVAEETIRYGADRVLLIEHEDLNAYSNDLYVKSLSDSIDKEMPNAFLIGATPYGRDLAGRLAARLRTGLTANAITMEMNEKGEVIFGVPAYGGKIVAEIVCEKARPQMSTVRPGTFNKIYDPKRKGKVNTIVPDLTKTHNRVKILERNVSKIKDLSKSERTIVGGNGTGGDITLVKRLAELTNCDIGVTRPLADKGLVPRDLQVGSTGYSLKSKIALILGVSGSEHFTSGIKDCGTVISIDLDEKSEIFNHSDYCIIGDVSEIVPLVIQKLEGKK